MKNYRSAQFLLILFACLVFSSNLIQAQNVSISPSRLYYKVGVGEFKSQELSVTNNGSSKQAFNILFSDFEPSGIEGKSKFMEAGESVNSCTKWLSATPSFFDLEPGQTQKIQVLMQIPNSPDANKVKWSALKIKLAKEQKSSNRIDNSNSFGMGVSETFQFVVHVFQSPPTVTLKNAVIENFRQVSEVADTNLMLALQVKNSGEAILDCASYLEYTNLQTGKEERMKPVAFTVLPGALREIKFSLPNNLPKGKYSMLGVVDYGSHENVQAAELQLEIK